VLSSFPSLGLLNIQGTFREHAGDTQGAFREHTGNIQGTFRAFREHSGSMQGTFSYSYSYFIGSIVSSDLYVKIN
jgi:hypothetical protein